MRKYTVYVYIDSVECDSLVLKAIQSRRADVIDWYWTRLEDEAVALQERGPGLLIIFGQLAPENVHLCLDDVIRTSDPGASARMDIALFA